MELSSKEELAKKPYDTNQHILTKQRIWMFAIKVFVCMGLEFVSHVTDTRKEN
jgi:hypothetical protein